MAEVAIILTVRSDSERFRDKCFLKVKNKPLVYWIVKRLQRIKKSQVVLATTHLSSDDRLADIGKQLKTPVFRGDNRDVVDRVDNAVRAHVPESKLVFRALADMPFIGVELLDRAIDVLLGNPDAEAMVWHSHPHIWPVYGAREFPYSRSGWNKIARRAYTIGEREHSDMFFHRNRRMFNIIYHEPPKNIYYRPYRLEVDYPEDGEMVSAIAAKIGMLKPLSEVIKFLDKNPEIARLNRERVEKTGPITSYEFDLHRQWVSLMKGKPELDWNDKWWQPKTSDHKPVFCENGHLLGYAQYGTLFTRNDEVQLEAGKVACQFEGCESSEIWHLAQSRRVY